MRGPEARFPARKPFWMEMHIFLSRTLCSGQRQQREPRRAQPAEPCGMKTSRLSCHRLGWWWPSAGCRGVSAEVGRVHGVAGGTYRAFLQPPAQCSAAGKCSSRPFLPEHLVLCGLAAVSAWGPGVPGRRARASVGRALSLPAGPVGPGLAVCCPCGHAACPGCHPERAWSHARARRQLPSWRGQRSGPDSQLWWPRGPQPANRSVALVSAASSPAAGG